VVVQIDKTLKKVGGSVMLPIPPEILRQMDLQAEQVVRLSSEAGRFYVEPVATKPAPDAVEFMARFTDKYDEAFRNLAQR
jgi:antitoxin component of MazEF toxin-antitoxin module